MSSLLDKFAKLKQEANLQAFLDKDAINEKGREKRKLEAKEEKTAEEEKKIRQIQQETERLAKRQQQAQQIVNRASLGEKIIKGYFLYKAATLLGHALLDQDHDRDFGGIEDELRERIEHGEIDIQTARAEQIEQFRDQFDKINEEAKAIGIGQGNIFTQQDRDSLTALAAISRDVSNVQQAELYAAKCEELGLNREEALQAFQQDSEPIQRELKADKEQNKSYGLED